MAKVPGDENRTGPRSGGSRTVDKDGKEVGGGRAPAEAKKTTKKTKPSEASSSGEGE